MSKIRRFLEALVLLASVSLAFAATTTLETTDTSGTCVLTLKKSAQVERTGSGLYVYKFVCTSDSLSSGSVVTETPTIQGQVLACVTVPGTSTLAPTYTYGVTMLDSTGRDILAAKGGTRSITVVEQFAPLVGNGTGADGLSSANGYVSTYVNDALTVSVTTLGSANQTTIYLFVNRF